MAMTQTALVILATLATLTSGALFKEFGDRWTRTLLLITSSLLWGIMGISAFDVRMQSTLEANIATDEPIMPLVFVGVGLAMVVGVFAIWEFFRAVRDETSMTSNNPLQ